MVVRKVKDLAILEFEPEKKILTITFRPINLDLEAAKAISDEVDKLLKEYEVDKLGVISDMRDLLHITRTAREFFAKEGDQEKVAADAIVITSPILRELYNISMRFTKPKYPVRAFSSLLNAREWVEKMLRGE